MAGSIMTGTITNSVTVNGQGLYASTTRQARVLKGSLSYVPDIDPRIPNHISLAANLQQNDKVVGLSSVDDVPVPDIGQSGALRVGNEVIQYNDVITANNTVVISQRNVANTGAVYSGNIKSGNVVSILGLGAAPTGQRVGLYNGNLLFTATSLGADYVSSAVYANISSPELRAGFTAIISAVYLYANGAVQALTVSNVGSGYIANPTITLTGSNTTAFVGIAALTTV
jgi:hypothetical protein